MVQTLATIEQPVQPVLAVATPIGDIPNWMILFVGAAALTVGGSYMVHQGRKLKRWAIAFQTENPEAAQQTFKDEAAKGLGNFLEQTGVALQSLGREPDLKALHNPATLAQAIFYPRGANLVCQECDADDNGVLDVLEDNNPNDRQQLERLLSQIESQILNSSSDTEARLEAISQRLEQQIRVFETQPRSAENGWTGEVTNASDQHIAVIPAEGGIVSVTGPEVIQAPSRTPSTSQVVDRQLEDHGVASNSDENFVI